MQTQVIEAPWNRPLEANHIVSVPPERQKSYPPGQQFTMAGIDVKMANDGSHANAWYLVSSDFGPTAGARSDTAKFNIVGKATGNNGSDFPLIPLYGVLGTGEEGWVYYPNDRTWRKSVILPDVPGQTGYGTSGDPYRPSGAVDAAAMPNRPGKELGLYNGKNGGIWYAGTQAQSLACQEHKGISYAGPETWQGVWGKPEDNGLPTGLYLVTADDPMDPRTARPAGKEWKTVLIRAQNGDDAAIEVMDFFGESTDTMGGDTIWDELEDIFH